MNDPILCPACQKQAPMEASGLFDELLDNGTIIRCPDCGFQVAGPDRLQVERAVGMLWDYGLPYVGETDDGGRA